MLRIVGRGRHADSELLASYRATPSGGFLSSKGLLVAQQWLAEQGWLTREGTTLGATARSLALPDDDETEVARELVRAMILDSLPAWLSASTARGEVREEFLPEDASALFEEMFDDDERDAILLAAASKYDAEALRELGEAGEDVVLSACRDFLEARGRPDLARKARRVSLISDAMGWDISSPNLAGELCRLEVKCYRGRDPTVYLTRNEFEVGSRRPRWYLVLCRSTGDSAPEVVGWTTLTPLIPRMPVDVVLSAEWQVTKIRIDASELRPGLPLDPADALADG
ncbi:MAG: DUF3883 domain-containing protein [Chloroflexi bacterium]|nr:DUF3883 domain-containing protein [Chloroflexota bacterium]